MMAHSHQSLNLVGAKSSLKQLEETKTSLNEEIGTKLNEKLSDEEQETLVQLNDEIEKLKKQLIDISSQRAQVIHSHSTLLILTHWNRARAVRHN